MYITQLLRHKQNVTQGQFLRGVCINPTPPPQAECDTRSIFKGVCINPTPPPQTECDTRSIFKWSMY